MSESAEVSRKLEVELKEKASQYEVELKEQASQYGVELKEQASQYDALTKELESLKTQNHVSLLMYIGATRETSC